MDAAVSAFLAGAGAPSADADLLSYVTSILQDAAGAADAEEREDAAASLAEIVPGADPAAVAALVEAWCDPASISDSPPRPTGGAAVAAADLSPSALIRAVQLRVASTEEAEEEEGGAGGGGGDPAEAAPTVDPAALAGLASLFPSADPSFLEHTLRVTAGAECGAPPDAAVAGAAAWLVDAPGGAAAAQARWAAAAKAAAAAAVAAAAAEAAAKARVLSKFDQEAVGATGRPAAAWGGEKGGGKKGGGAPAAVRYHNGQVVSRRGEKYVTEEVTPAWDGGSKGKVYTKGKRGKGVVG